MSKAVAAFCHAWWKLERREVEIDVAADDEHEQHILGLEYAQMDGDDGIKKVTEILLAEIESNNVGSLKVVERCGFVKVGEECVRDHDDSPKDQTVILEDWILLRPGT